MLLINCELCLKVDSINRAKYLQVCPTTTTNDSSERPVGIEAGRCIVAAIISSQLLVSCLLCTDTGENITVMNDYDDDDRRERK